MVSAGCVPAKYLDSVRHRRLERTPATGSRSAHSIFVSFLVRPWLFRACPGVLVRSGCSHQILETVQLINCRQLTYFSWF